MSRPTRKRRTLPRPDGVLARQIQELRRKQNVSQDKLAKLLGVTQSAVARMESGDRAITVAELFRIAAALDCAPVYLLSGGLTDEPVPVTPQLSLQPDDAEAWIIGAEPLPGGNRRAYTLENISARRAAEIEANTVAVTGVRAGATAAARGGKTRAK